MAPIPDGYAQVNWKFRGTQYPNGAEVTFAVKLDDPTDTPTSVATFMAAEWVTRFKPHATSTTTLDTVLCKFGPTDVGPSSEVASGQVGSVPDTGIQPATAWLIRKNTALGGRPGKGRCYMPGLAESAVRPDGSIEPANLVAFGVAAQNFLNDCAANDTPLYLLHGGNFALLFPSEITTLTVDGRVATQRRRLRR